MHYDHIDIGTSDFNVADGEFLPAKRYLLVEPMVEYLDRLPSGEHIVKECAACSLKDGEMDLHFVPPADIERLSLPQWMRGCNRLGARHMAASALLEQAGLDKDIMVFRRVPTIRFDTLCRKHNVTSAGFVKIDTEGHDHVILSQIADHLLRHKFTCDKLKVEYIRSHGNIRYLDQLALSLRKVFPFFSFDPENLTLWK